MFSIKSKEFTMQFTQCSIQKRVYTKQSTVLNIQTWSIIKCTGFTIQNKVLTIQRIVLNIQRHSKLFTIHCSVLTIQSRVFALQYTVSYKQKRYMVYYTEIGCIVQYTE